MARNSKGNSGGSRAKDWNTAIKPPPAKPPGNPHGGLPTPGGQGGSKK